MTLPFKRNHLYEEFIKVWDDRPLAVILALAVVFRLLAALFAKGWGMLDDHFLIIEAPQSWVYGYDYNSWLPSTKGNTGPSGHNFFYPGFHYLLFRGMQALGIHDPQGKMLIVRLIHGTFSLITVWAGYRIVETLSDKRAARLTGLLLAVYFFMPWISVRNLAESTCIPFVMLAFLEMIRHKEQPAPFRSYFVAGLWFGLAMDIRYQLVFFPAGVALVLLFNRKWRETAAILLGAGCSFLVVQTMIDLLIWGYPFAEFAGYIAVNITDRNSYFNLPWYNYFLTVGGLLLPPVSLFFFYGFFKSWRSYLLLFVPAALFFVFHSWFPNKQERFILPFLPVFIMLGVMGYYRYLAGSRFELRNPRLIRGSWYFFWVVNTILLVGVTFIYSKRSRVESMYHLYRYPYVRNIILEDENGNVPLLPLFYSGKWPEYPNFRSSDTTIYQQVEAIAAGPRLNHPQFFLFTGGKNLQQRVIRARQSFPFLVYETTSEPGFIDILMHRLNPVNKAERIYIYRNASFYKYPAR